MDKSLSLRCIIVIDRTHCVLLFL